MKNQPPLLLLVDDDPAHAEIVRRNLKTSPVAHRLKHVADGQQALDYLFRYRAYSDPRQSPRPDVILLDLRMPRVDGLEVLQTIKNDQELGDIPVVILTTSDAGIDIDRAYDFHANGYLVKPLQFERFAELLTNVVTYWLTRNCPPCRCS